MWIRKRKSKFGNQKTASGNFTFDSKLESDLYNMLYLREKAGELRELKVKPNVFITDAQIRCIPDFGALENGQQIYFEAKGFKTPVWAIKRRLWEFYGPSPLEVWIRSGNGLMLAYKITPRERKVFNDR